MPVTKFKKKIKTPTKPVVEKPVEAKKPSERIKRFRILEGMHYEKYKKERKNPDGTTTTTETTKEFKKGSVCETTRNLIKVYGNWDPDYYDPVQKKITGIFRGANNKFRRLPDKPQQFEEDEEIEIEDPEEVAQLQGKPSPSRKPKSRGTDVTKEFDIADELEYKVFIRHDKKYDVYNSEGEQVNEKPLKKKQIEECINEYLENEDVEEDVEPEDDDSDEEEVDEAGPEDMEESEEGDDTSDEEESEEDEE